MSTPTARKSAAKTPLKTVAKAPARAPLPPARKPTAKSAAKAPAQGAAPTKAAAPAKVAAPAKATTPPQPAAPMAPAPMPAVEAKPPKQKLVRDSFTIPRSEYQQLDALKQRLVRLMRPTKKSELLRAGIKLLAALPDDALRAAAEAVPSIKTGRPGKAKAA